MLCVATFGPHASAASALDDGALRQLARPTVLRVIAEGDDFASSGTGFVLNEDGYVATNEHVVAGATSFALLQGGSSSPATLIWNSPALDLAILRMRDRLAGLELVTLALSSPEENSDQNVLAVGFPGVSDELAVGAAAVDPTSTPGEVSRFFEGTWGDGATLQIVQHTAAINSGNSGGPLFDACGRVIGVNTAGPNHVVSTPGGPQLNIRSGTYWASFAGTLAHVLESQGIEYQRTEEKCVAAAFSGVSAEDVEQMIQEEIEGDVDRIQERIEEVERSLRDADGRDATGLREELARLRAQLQEEIEGDVDRIQERIEEVERSLREAGGRDVAALQDELARLQTQLEAAATSGMGITAAVGTGVAIFLFIAAAVAFASFKRSILHTVSRRVQEGASRVVQEGASRVVPSRSERGSRSAEPRRLPEYPRRLRIGRGRDMDVVVRSESVSRLHADLVISSPGGRYRLTDCGSTNGTSVLRGGRWREVQDDVVGPEEHVKLGDYQTTPRALERMARLGHPGHQERQRRSGGEYGGEHILGRVGDDRPSSIAVRRNSTGQVVPRDRR